MFNNTKNQCIFTDRATDQALSDLAKFGVTDAQVCEDLIKKKYAEGKLLHIKEIPWLLEVAWVTEVGKKRLAQVEEEDRTKPQSERLKQSDLFDVSSIPLFYLGLWRFDTSRIEKEIALGHKVELARACASNVKMMDNGFLDKRFPEYFASHDEC